jgi:hypothetical protein
MENVQVVYHMVPTVYGWCGITLFTTDNAISEEKHSTYQG